MHTILTSCFCRWPTHAQAWRAALPRVVPFYAIKCNPEPGMVRLLAALGAGFDCASLGEVKQVLDAGVPASRIIFAHPCKRPCDIHFARDAGVNLTTFDTESELTKVRLAPCLARTPQAAGGNGNGVSEGGREGGSGADSTVQ